MNLNAIASSTETRERKLNIRSLLVPVCASLVVAAAARVAFPLPFTPVPFTLQPLAVLGVGLALGPWQGASAMLLYLAEGALGLPVFSPTGPGGLAQILGPTGGFLLAYPAVAFVSGLFTQGRYPVAAPFWKALIACTLATALLFLFGATWLSVEAHMTLRQTLFAAVLPFLPGESIKILAAAGAYRALKSSSLRFHSW